MNHATFPLLVVWTSYVIRWQPESKAFQVWTTDLCGMCRDEWVVHAWSVTRRKVGNRTPASFHFRWVLLSGSNNFRKPITKFWRFPFRTQLSDYFCYSNSRRRNSARFVGKHCSAWVTSTEWCFTFLTDVESKNPKVEHLMLLQERKTDSKCKFVKAITISFPRSSFIHMVTPAAALLEES